MNRLALFFAFALAAFLLFSCSESKENDGDNTGKDKDAAEEDGGEETPKDDDDADRGDEEKDGGEKEPPKECVAAGPNCAPDPSKAGPYPVGVKTITITYNFREGSKEMERALKTEIWYPTTEEAAASLPLDAYNLRDDMPERILPEFEGMEINPITQQAYRDAPLRAEDAPYPLLLFSHGNGGIRYQSTFFCAHIASHGYVVVSPDHVGDTMFDFVASDKKDIEHVLSSVPERPADMNAVQKEFFRMNEDSSDFFFGSIDEGRVGISGHSFGGHTTVVVGGRNPYITAAAPMAAPAASYKLEGYLQKPFPVPILMHGATRDDSVTYDQQEYAWKNMLGEKAAFATLIDGGHFSYTDICRMDIEAVAKAAKLNVNYILRDGCGEDNIPYEIAHDYINTVTTAFFNYHLRKSKESAAYFAPEYYSESEAMTVERRGY